MGQRSVSCVVDDEEKEKTAADGPEGNRSWLKHGGGNCTQRTWGEVSQGRKTQSQGNRSEVRTRLESRSRRFVYFGEYRR